MFDKYLHIPQSVLVNLLLIDNCPAHDTKYIHKEYLDLLTHLHDGMLLTLIYNNIFGWFVSKIIAANGIPQDNQIENRS